MYLKNVVDLVYWDEKYTQIKTKKKEKKSSKLHIWWKLKGCKSATFSADPGQARGFSTNTVVICLPLPWLLFWRCAA